MGNLGLMYIMGAGVEQDAGFFSSKKLGHHTILYHHRHLTVHHLKESTLIANPHHHQRRHSRSAGTTVTPPHPPHPSTSYRYREQNIMPTAITPTRTSQAASFDESFCEVGAVDAWGMPQTIGFAALAQLDLAAAYPALSSISINTRTSMPHQVSKTASTTSASLHGAGKVKGAGSGRRELKEGNRVSVVGYGTGTVRYFGKHAHKKRKRVGVELDQPVGLNNGTVSGHTYFVCQQGCGVLVVPSKAARLSSSTTNRPLPVTSNGSFCEDSLSFWQTMPVRAETLTPFAQAHPFPPFPTASKSPASSAAASAAASHGAGKVKGERRGLKEGNRVSVWGYGAGTVRFLGKHAHKKHKRVGVELDQPVGLNNGTVNGHTYFVCEDGHGLLVVPSKAARLFRRLPLSFGQPKTKPGREMKRSMMQKVAIPCCKDGGCGLKACVCAVIS
jgi:hypothetical protein